MKNNIFILNYKIITFSCLIILFISPSYADFSKTWEIASPSVVSVLPTWPGYKKPGFGAPAGTAPEGSGVIVSNNGLIVTASHVVSRATDVIVRDINGNRFNAEIIFDDPLTDLALLKTKINNNKININLKRPKIGSNTCLISNSFGLDLNITCGIVSSNRKSGIGFNSKEDFIQIDAAANPGSSGGAVVNENGELIGIMSGIFTKQSDTNVGVNFAISSELLIETISHLLK